MPKIDDAARDERRQRLLDAARACLTERAWRDTTIDDIAAAAGVSKGAVYTYFPSKTELLVALSQAGAASLDEAAAQVRTRGVDGLQRFVRESLRLAGSPSQAQIAADLRAALPSDPRLRSWFAEAIERRRTLLRGSIEHLQESGRLSREVKANALASILLALADGLTLHGAVDPDGFGWQNVREAVERLLDGLTVV